MKNIIIIGDSFCSTKNDDGWPRWLAEELGLELYCHGIGGQHWWGAKKFLDHRECDMHDNEVIVFVHTVPNRLPNTNEELCKINFSDPDTSTELGQAVGLYFKHIFDDEFLVWAQDRWFEEISTRYINKKMVHLHSFSFTQDRRHLLRGMNVVPSLTSISLNELKDGNKIESLYNDQRRNHLSDFNNRELARQLADAINNYHHGDMQLDLSKFDLATSKYNRVLGHKCQ